MKLLQLLRSSKRALFLALLLGLAPVLSSCGSDAKPAEAAPAVTLAQDTVVIDVRTTPEWNQGHLDGARLISLEEPGFIEMISALDRDANYLLYCRSGNRAGIAEAQMREMGFTNITNLGSVDNAASATGLQVVR